MEGKGNPMLKYLFSVQYTDGSWYRQNDVDVSISDLSRSCFYDVEQHRVARFGISGGGVSYFVDLRDGHFEVNGTPFFMHEGELSGFRLIFFRRHTHTFLQDMTEAGHEVVWRLGWQANGPDGENVQRVMEVR